MGVHDHVGTGRDLSLLFSPQNLSFFKHIPIKAPLLFLGEGLGWGAKFLTFAIETL
jgi:hypothetical protein